MRILRPFRHRDFALLWTGRATSMIGDGLYQVALPFLVLGLHQGAGGLSVVLLAWSIGLVGFLLAGGLVADRFDRRAIMVVADTTQLVAVTAIGALTVTGSARLWEIAVLAGLYGAGEAFFQPAFGGLLPSLVPAEDLVQANAAYSFTQPLAFRLVGPVLGGVLVATVGTGTTMLVDAGTFLVALGCVVSLRGGAMVAAVTASAIGQLGEGWRYLRSQPWLWATLAGAAVGLLATFAPVDVLLPVRIRDGLGGNARDYGIVLAAGGAGAMLAALAVAQRGLPRHPVAALYLLWMLSDLAITGWGFGDRVWQLAALSVVRGGGAGGGLVIWESLIRLRVPGPLLGRVTSLDWLCSVGLTPVSFAIVAPLAGAIGVTTTLAAAGVFGALTLVAMAPFAGRPPAEPVLDAGQAPSAAMSAVNDG